MLRVLVVERSAGDSKTRCATCKLLIGRSASDVIEWRGCVLSDCTTWFTPQVVLVGARSQGSVGGTCCFFFAAAAVSVWVATAADVLCWYYTVAATLVTRVRTNTNPFEIYACTRRKHNKQTRTHTRISQIP